MEKYQIERIELIKKLLLMFGDNYILKGGTALTLYYGCNRYSEDIDLDCRKENMNFLKNITNPGYKIWNVSVKKDTPTVFRTMIDYGAKNEYGNYPLKIEVSSRNKNILMFGNLKINNFKSVNVYDICTLKKQKIKAFQCRDKIRDYFDIGFLMRKYSKLFTLDDLETIFEKVQLIGIESLVALLDYENNRNKISDVNSEEYVLETQYILEKLVKNLRNNVNIEW